MGKKLDVKREEEEKKKDQVNLTNEGSNPFIVSTVAKDVIGIEMHHMFEL